MLQERTDRFLGKQPDIVLYNLSSNMIAVMTLPLPPVIVNLQAWPTGEGPSLRGTTRSTRYSGMTTPHLETPQGSLSLVNSLLTSHIEPHTLVLVSGNEHQLTYAQVWTRPAYGPGGFTNDGLCKQLQTILDWTSPPTQCPEFSSLPMDEGHSLEEL
jgi:hypothetical protein